MTAAQEEELDSLLLSALRSSTIEWAQNLRICDLLQANPPLAPIAMRHIAHRLQKESPAPVLLALSLLEMLVKNCGMRACQAIDEELAGALVALVKKRQSWRYSVGRNLHHSLGGWLPEGLAINDSERGLWNQASYKVLEMLQLWSDAFLLQEGQLQPLFSAYKQLRQEGYKFPRGEHGAAASGLCLVRGAEESPAFLAGAAGTGAVEEPRGSAPAPIGDGGRGPGGTPSPPRAAAAAAPAPEEDVLGKIVTLRSVLDSLRAGVVGASDAAGEGGDNPELRRAALLEQATAARPWARSCVEREMEAGNESHVEALLFLLEDLNSLLGPEREEEGEGGAGDAASPPAAVPPPPSAAPPDREQQEMYDLILARYLQEREDAILADEEEDAALAWRLSMEEHQAAFRPHRPHEDRPVARCAVCGAPNRLPPAAGQEGLRFFCYACGNAQVVPQPAAGASHHGWHQSSAGSQLHAPPPRVICAGADAPELLIGNCPAEPPRAGSRQSSTAPESATALPSLFASASSPDPLSGGAASSASLLGAPVSKSAKAWAKYASSAARYASSAASSVASTAASALVPPSEEVKRLGDGTPMGEYAELGGDETAGSLLGNGPPQSKGSSSSYGSWLGWKAGGGSSKRAEVNAPLIDRVRVDDEWELIRPPEGQPYWYNTATQVSQWEPPDVVRKLGAA